jgi:hypothetical protein
MDNISKDVVIAILGAAVGLAGILLVFCGFILSQVWTFDPDEIAKSKRTAYKIVARIGILPFLGALMNAYLCVRWFITRSDALYSNVTCTFGFLLLATGLYGAVVVLFFL